MLESFSPVHLVISQHDGAQGRMLVSVFVYKCYGHWSWLSTSMPGVNADVTFILLRVDWEDFMEIEKVASLQSFEVPALDSSSQQQSRTRIIPDQQIMPGRVDLQILYQGSQKMSQCIDV